MPSCSASLCQRSGRRSMMLFAVLLTSYTTGTSAGSTVGAPKGGVSSGHSGAAPPSLRDEFDDMPKRHTKTAEVEDPMRSIVMNNYFWAGLSFIIGIAIVRFFQSMEDVEPDVTTGPTGPGDDVKAKSKTMHTTPSPLKPHAVEASSADESPQIDANACSGMDGDSEAKVQTLDKKVPVRLRRPPSFQSKLTLIDEANAEMISAMSSQKRSPAPSRPLPAPGDFQRLFRDTRRAFAEALEDLEKDEWEDRLRSPEGKGLFRESQKAFASALEDIESEDRLRSPSFVSVN